MSARAGHPGALAAGAVAVVLGGSVAAFGCGKSGEARPVAPSSVVEVAPASSAVRPSVLAHDTPPAADPQAVVSLRLGFEHTCALHADHSVSCWGAAGIGAPPPAGERDILVRPTRVPDVHDAAEVVVGTAWTCVRPIAGTLRCWGSGYADTSLPLEDSCVVDILGARHCRKVHPNARRPIEVPGIEDATEIATGGSHSCALSKDGRVRCWGYNVDGQVGVDPHDVQAPTVVQGVADAVHVACGPHASAALARDGSVFVWGDNRDGLRGDGTEGGRHPQARRVPGLGAVVEIAMGGSQVCARQADASVRCWGWAATDGGGSKNVLRPTAVPGLGAVAQLALGSGHACARKVDGTVACWGVNTEGLLGDGTTVWRLRPTPVPGLANVVELAAGPFHSCARRSDGAVLCWGANDHGELGDGTRERRLSPVVVRF